MTQQQQNKEEEIGAGTKKKVRKFRSMREAGAGEHADYWVFYKVCFENHWKNEV
jgi:hypothetical protein